MTISTLVTGHFSGGAKITGADDDALCAKLNEVIGVVNGGVVGMPAHVDTTGKQGGTTAQFYHLTAAQHADQILQLPEKALAGTTPAAGDYAAMTNKQWCFAVGTGGKRYVIQELTAGHFYVELTAV